MKKAFWNERLLLLAQASSTASEPFTRFGLDCDYRRFPSTTSLPFTTILSLPALFFHAAQFRPVVGRNWDMSSSQTLPYLYAVSAFSVLLEWLQRSEHTGKCYVSKPVPSFPVSAQFSARIAEYSAGNDDLPVCAELRGFVTGRYVDCAECAYDGWDPRMDGPKFVTADSRWYCAQDVGRCVDNNNRMCVGVFRTV